MEQGGVVLAKLLLDRIDHRSFEGNQALLVFLSTFNICNFSGEDVSLATTRFKAAAHVLPKGDRSTDLVTFYLNGLAQASCSKFVLVVNAQIGFLSMPVAQDWASKFQNCLLQQLDEVANTCVAKYEMLRQTGEWSGANNKNSVFNVRPSRAPTSRPSDKKDFNRVEWLNWYDTATCGVCGKYGHPTKHHGDPGARDRSNEGWHEIYKQRQAGASRPKSDAVKSSPHPGPRFRSGRARQ